jgi:hypothetical protein
VEADVERRDNQFNARLSSFESAPGAKTIFEISLGVEASEKAKRASEGLAIIG